MTETYTRWSNHTYRDGEVPDVAKKHPGFKATAAKIGKKYGSAKRGAAILAASTRKASPKAKKRNPRLKRVKG